MVVVMLATEGFALSAFVYYLDHKRRMYMLQNGISQEEPLDVRLDRRLFGGLFLLLTGIALAIFPKVASSVGLEVSPTTGLLLIGIVAFSAGLATILGYCILKSGLSSLADRGRKL